MQIHTHYRERGGEDAVVETDAELLEGAGHTVRQHTEQNPSDSMGALVKLSSAAWNLGAERRFAVAMDEFCPDVVHVHNTWFSMSPSVLFTARRRNVPVVMTVHNYRLICANSLFMRDGQPCEDCLVSGTHNAVRHRCYRGGIGESAIAAATIAAHRSVGVWNRLVDRFLPLSAFAEGRLVASGLAQDKMLRIANNVPDPGQRAGPPSRSHEVVFAGRISREKGLAHLIEAWRIACPRGLALTVLGDGVERAALEASAPAGVTFCGRVPAAEVRSRFSRARAVVIPSTWYEGQPIVALEAMAAGVPLVLSDIGGLPELFGSADAGWLVPPGDPAALAAALHELSDDEVDRRGAAARRRYEEQFTPERAVPRLEAAYRSVGAES